MGPTQLSSPKQSISPADPPAQIWRSALFSGGAGGTAFTCCPLLVVAEGESEADVIAVAMG